MTSGAGQAVDMIVKREDDYATVLQVVHERRYTGSFTVHCLNGVPHKVEFPGVQIALKTAELDKVDKLVDST